MSTSPYKLPEFVWDLGFVKSSDLKLDHGFDLPGCCPVTKLCPTLCDPTGCSTLGFPILHYLPEFAQTHVH